MTLHSTQNNAAAQFLLPTKTGVFTTFEIVFQTESFSRFIFATAA